MEHKDEKFGRVVTAIRNDGGNPNSRIGRISKLTEVTRFFVVGVLATLNKLKRAKLRRWWENTLQGLGETEEEEAEVRKYVEEISSE